MFVCWETPICLDTSHLFERREVQIDFFIHLWPSRPNPSSACPPLLNEHRHFIDTGLDAAILFLTLYVMYWSPACLFICTGVDTRWIHAHTISQTHEHRGTYTHGLPFGQGIIVVATLRWRTRCAFVCVRDIQTLTSDYWFLVILLLPVHSTWRHRVVACFCA